MINELCLYPHFIVPPQCKQARLFMERAEDENEAFYRTFELTTSEGVQCISPAVYFGSLLIYEKGEVARFDENNLERCVAADLGYAFAPVLRIDYACTDERVFFLRAGEPKKTPDIYSAYSPQTIEYVEEYVDDFLFFTNYRTLLMNRGIMTYGEDLLFEGEERYYAGYLGNAGLPLKMKKATGSRLYEIDGGFMVVSCEEM